MSLLLIKLKKNILNSQAFLPYLEQSFEEIFKLVNYPQDDIRRASVEALQQFCISLYKVLIYFIFPFINRRCSSNGCTGCTIYISL